MRTLTDQLSQYAAYHRDRRNIATHALGIPMIVVAVAAMLSRPAIDVAGLPLSLAVLVTIAIVIFYLVLDVGLGCAMAVLMFVALLYGAWAARQSTAVWLGLGVGVFIVGWALQFVGHHYEGRKPAFVDDVIGLAIGPLFIVAEAVFALGLRTELLREIESRVGPTRAIRLHDGNGRTSA